MTTETVSSPAAFAAAEFIATCGPTISNQRFTKDPGGLERVSKDFYWYSPVLKPLLEDKRAELAFTPKTLNELEFVVSKAAEVGVPISLRGAGTGNYGQLVPLYGGLVIDLSSLDKIIRIDETEGYVVAEPGVRLGKIEAEARKVGWELRCYPSTWVKASVGGFLGGGSGGIGSISHGGLRENGTVRGVEIMTIEEKPRRIWIRGEEALSTLHSYGTTCIIVTIELALAQKVAWGQVAVAFDTFAECVDFTEAIARNAAVQKRLCTCFEWPIPSFFAPLKEIVTPGKSMTFLEVREDQIPMVKELVGASGRVTFEMPYQEVRKGPLLSDYTWNHTTLWAIKADPTWTYLQSGFKPDRLREQIKLLKDKYGDDFLFHLEFVKNGETIVPGSLPVIRYTTDERVAEMIAFCESIGVGVSNPHTYLVNAGRPIPMTDKKYELKKQYDPKNLLNPGKLPNAALPAAVAAAM